MDNLSKRQRSYNMSKIRSKNTLPEMKVRKKLFAAGLRYRTHTKGIPGKPDISIKKYKIIIDIKGCFWHRHPKCKYSSTPKSNTHYWIKKINNNVVRDKNIQKVQKSLGYKIFEIWECEINDKDKLCPILKKIFCYLNKNFNLNLY